MSADVYTRPFVSTILTAYRLDVAVRSGSAFGSDDGTWIQFATLVSQVHMHHADGSNADGSNAAREAAVRLGRALIGDAAWAEGYRLDPVRPSSETSLEGRVRAISEMAEDAGALNLAEAMLVAFVDSGANVTDLERGRVEAVRARLAWKSGRHDVAKERYERTLRTARRIRSDELRVRGLIGRAVLARLAGNYPLSRDIARDALRLATRGEMRRLAGTCHHMLMVCAALAKRFQDAIVHGWEAYLHATNDPILEAEVLGNLGQLFLDTGDAETALASFRAVLDRQPSERIRVPALGGLALAFAREGDSAGVFAATEQLVQAADNARPYDVAVAFVELGEAHAIVGAYALAADFRARALAIASANSYNEIPFRIERSLAANRHSRGTAERVKVVAKAVRQLAHA